MASATGRLLLWADGRSLHCQISDDGPADQDATRPDPAEWQHDHGHGLWFIDQLADQVTVDHDPVGTTVTVTSAIRS